MIKNNNYLDSLSKNLLNDVRGVMEGKKKACKCDNNCACGKEEKGEAEEKEMKEGSMPTADEPTDANKKTADKVRAMMAKEKGEVKEAKKMKGEDPCWKDYKMVGTKKGKGGKEVPNCVPEETEIKEGEEKGGGYNGKAVNKAISSSRQKIGSREAKKIHALLKGSTGYAANKNAEDTKKTFPNVKHLTKDGHPDWKKHGMGEEIQLEEGEEKGGGYNAPTAKGAMTYKKVLGQHTVRKGNTFHRSFPSEGDAVKYIQKNQGNEPKKKTYSYNEEAELDEAKAESPIKGTRLISKHEGKDGHHAEVRHNSEYDEFQVHHYENGKHMGEGPVSYHDTKADAKEAAEYEVKNYRPKNGSLRKEEVEVVDNEFNRTNYKHLIGKKFKSSEIPSYARVKEVSKTTKEEVELDEKLIGKQHKLDKDKNGRLNKKDFDILRKEETIEEKLDPSMGAGKYVTDFVKSKDPRFEGKTKKERIKMALGAYYGAKNEAVETEEVDAIDEGYGDKTDYKKHHISVDGRYVATTTWARSAKEAEKKFIEQHPEHKNARITVVKER